MRSAFDYYNNKTINNNNVISLKVLVNHGCDSGGVSTNLNPVLITNVINLKIFVTVSVKITGNDW